MLTSQPPFAAVTSLSEPSTFAHLEVGFRELSCKSSIVPDHYMCLRSRATRSGGVGALDNDTVCRRGGDVPRPPRCSDPQRFRRQERTWVARRAIGVC